MATIAELRAAVEALTDRAPQWPEANRRAVQALAAAVTELDALRARVAALGAEVAALRATATTPPWRAGPRG